MRALETAMAVSYSRAFTKSTLKTLLDEYVPTNSPDAELRAWFRDRRDTAYAHGDKTSGRDASARLVEVEGEVVPAEWRVEWIPFRGNGSIRPSASSRDNANGSALTP